LPPDDILLLSGNSNFGERTVIDAQAVKSFIESKVNDATYRKSRSKTKWLSNSVNTLAQFALNIQTIVGPLASQSPEYAVPLGCLMIIFKVNLLIVNI